MTWGGVRVKEKPVALPLSADQLRARLNLLPTGDDDEDAADALLLADMCAAAVAEIDGPDGVGFAMMRQTWALSLDGFAPVITLPGAPITAVQAVRYLGADGAWVDLDPARYRVALGRDPVRLVPVGAGWPAVPSGPGVVEVLYELGADDPADLDRGLVTAVAMLTAHYFANREAVAIGGGAAVEVPLGVQRALDRVARGKVAG